MDFGGADEGLYARSDRKSAIPYQRKSNSISFSLFILDTFFSWGRERGGLRVWATGIKHFQLAKAPSARFLVELKFADTLVCD